MSELFIPDPDADFLPILGLGSRGQKGTGSWIRIRNTGLFLLSSSVADPGCLSQIPDPGSRILIFTHPGSRISDPGSRIPDLGSRISDPGSRIPDPKTATKERDEIKICCHNYLCSHKFHKIAK
jgi:hypothetical protein